MQFTGEYWSRLSDLSVRYPCIAVENIADLTTTITSTNATTTPIDKDMTVTIPSDVPVANVGGISVPVMTDIAAPDLLNPAIDMPGVVPGTQTGITAGEITGAITDALPITGTIAGDQTVTQVMTEPDSLGALMITKFPFSIPWDVYKAIKLLAAPPVTPRWEVDFMEPLADNVGGFPGDTTIVIDFSEYEIVGIVTRWTSTIMFIYALASGTKRLLWTA